MKSKERLAPWSIYCCYLKIGSNTVFVKVHMLQYFVILNIPCYKAVQRIQKKWNSPITFKPIFKNCIYAVFSNLHNTKCVLKFICHFISKWLAFRDWETFFLKELNYWLFFCLHGTKISCPFLAVMHVNYLINLS